MIFVEVGIEGILWEDRKNNRMSLPKYRKCCDALKTGEKSWEVLATQEYGSRISTNLGGDTQNPTLSMLKSLGLSTIWEYQHGTGQQRSWFVRFVHGT